MPWTSFAPVVCLLILATLLASPRALGAEDQANPNRPVLVSAEGTVEVLPVGAMNWKPAKVGQALQPGDQIRTGAKSRAAVRLSNLSILRLSEFMNSQIEPGKARGSKGTVNVNSGSAYFFSRDKPQEIEIRTPIASGAIRGTEFEIVVADDGRTTNTMVDGEL